MNLTIKPLVLEMGYKPLLAPTLTKQNKTQPTEEPCGGHNQVFKYVTANTTLVQDYFAIKLV